MAEPVRIQRKRTKGFSLQAASPNGLPVVYVGRPTKWGNPFRVGQTCYTGKAAIFPLPTNAAVGKLVANGILVATCCASAEMAVEWYRQWLRAAIDPKCRNPLDLSELRGKNLACFCPLDQPCHASVLLKLANS